MTTARNLRLIVATAPDGRLEKEESPKKNHRGAAKREVEQMEGKEHPPK